MSDNPNYNPNALSRFYERIIGGIGKAWTALGWLPHNYVKVLAVGFLLLSPIWLWLIYEVFGELLTVTGSTIPRKTSDDVRNIAWALGITITALAGLLAAPLILVRAWVHERQTKAAAQQAETAEQGLITDRFTKAVEQLGSEKTVKYRVRSVRYLPQGKRPPDHVTVAERADREAELPEGAGDVTYGEWATLEQSVPNLEVRLGAIYALERIAQDSERDHIPIMETLCAYVRENAPGREAQDHDLGDWEPLPDDASEEDRKAHLERRKERFGSI